MQLITLRADQADSFKQEMQEAFQKGYEDSFGHTDEPILPDADFYESLHAPRSTAFEVVESGERLGGAIIVLSDDGKRGELHFLYTKVGAQNRGVGTFAWKVIEALFSDVSVWETCTPYFEVRNIHFYVNRCGFHIVEFFCSHHPGPLEFRDGGNTPQGEDGLFRFEKRISDSDGW